MLLKVTNHLQLSSVIGSNKITVPPPLSIALEWGAQIACSMSCHEHNTLLILYAKMLSSFYRSSKNLPKIESEP